MPQTEKPLNLLENILPKCHLRGSPTICLYQLERPETSLPPVHKVQTPTYTTVSPGCVYLPAVLVDDTMGVASASTTIAVAMASARDCVVTIVLAAETHQATSPYVKWAACRFINTSECKCFNLSKCIYKCECHIFSHMMTDSLLIR